VVVEVTAAPIDLTPPEPEPTGLLADLRRSIGLAELPGTYANHRTTEPTEGGRDAQQQELG
jgi:hypothetical protein